MHKRGLNAVIPSPLTLGSAKYALRLSLAQARMQMLPFDGLKKQNLSFNNRHMYDCSNQYMSG